MSNLSRNTPRFVKIVSPLALAITLAACGGGGDSFGGGGSGDRPEDDGSQDAFNESLNSKCSLKNGYDDVGFGLRITDEGAEDNEYDYIHCESSEPLVKVEADYLANKYPKVEKYFINSDNMANLQNIPNFPILNELIIRDVSNDTNDSEVLPSFSGLENLTSSNLEILRIQGHSADDLTPLQGHTNLKSLIIQKTSLTMDEDELGNSFVTDASPLAGLVNLEELSLVYTEITNVDFISNLTSLKDLDLSRNNISDISAMSNIAKTADVTLNGNKIVDATILSDWKGSLWLTSNCIPEANYATGVDLIETGQYSQVQQECSLDGIGGIEVAAIDVRTNSSQLLANGSNEVTITAVPKNADNNAIEADVSFSTQDNATLVVSGNSVVVTSDGALAGSTVSIAVKSGNIIETVVLNVTENDSPIEGGETVTSIDVRSDSLQLLVDGSKAITINVTPKNASNVAIPANVVFSTDGNATLIVNGTSATLSPDRANVGDSIVVSVKAGDIQRNINFTVIDEGDEVEGGEEVAAIDLRADSNQLLFDGSKAVNITAIPKNADNNAISADVRFSAVGNATLQVSGNTATLTSDQAQPGDIITVSVEAGELAPLTLDFTVVDVEQEAVLHLEPMIVGLSNLSAGGSTGITLELKDQNGDFAKTQHTATFSSNCISNGSSEIESPITSSTGVFTTTYTAKGCEGDDVITATVDSLKTTSTVNVTPANLGAVEFVSAEPKNILLKGMSAPGMQHTSKVTFLIKNDAGGPIANADVSFELVTAAVGDGGIKLATTTGKTNNDGIVSVILEAGSVHTSVRVRATVTRGATQISSESSSLVISTGVADQNSLSLSLETLNPAAWNHDGVQVGVNLYASDRYNNPVPDGTTVSFYTELGQIEPSCETTNGRCTVNWTSSNPRDLGTSDARYPRSVDTGRSDGITTITAKVIGEESFLDTNANGIFDDGDVFDTISDRGEAYADYNKGYTASVGYDDGLDRFILDYNGDRNRNPKDGLYTGLGCEHTSQCADDNGLKDIYTSIELVMAEDNQAIRIYDLSTSPETLVYDAHEGGAQVNPILAGDINYTGSTNYRLRDNANYRVEVFGSVNKQVPPVDTSIASSSEAAEVIVGSAIVASTNFHGTDVTSPYGAYTLPLFLEAGEKSAGTVAIKINAGGLETSYVVPYEIDSDGDGLTNSQDADDDNDGISDADELAAGTNRFEANPINTDTDGDGKTDASESDETSFEITDTNDNGISDVAEADTDSDGIPDDIDPDDDNDGVNDEDDAFPLDDTQS